MKYDTLEELLEYARGAENKTFSQIIDESENAKYTGLDGSKKKGFLGHVIEECYFEYKSNSRPEPDFLELGVELKVTPIRKNRNGTFSSKERLVLNIINYFDEVNREFEDSSFYKKNKFLLIMFYLYSDDTNNTDFRILKSYFNSYSAEDKQIIVNDWGKIKEMIVLGRAHELSESLTMYLGACPKGANKDSKVEQPNSDILAMQRAYCLKQSYMTTLARNVISNQNLERIINHRQPTKLTFEEYVISKLSQNYGKSQRELVKKFNIESDSKSLNDMIIARILGVKGKVSKTDEFQKAQIMPKSIRIERDGTINEDMSFKTFNPKEINSCEWFASELRDMFDSTKFLLTVFRKDNNEEYIFSKAFFWSIPQKILDGTIKTTWEETKRVIRAGIVIEEKKGRYFNNLPGKTFNHICHVRPKASRAMKSPGDSNSFQLPDGRWMTNQCFWLDKDFILKVINQNE